METCVRGFSFMPTEKKNSTDSLKYIEGEELTRKWRASRRERQKQREQLIWEEFVVKENDVLSTLCKEDPYQFLEQLPEECLKELMEEQLRKMKEEKEEEENKIMELSQHGEGDTFPGPPGQEVQEVQHIVTFAEGVEKENDDVFQIFDDKDEDKSGPEDDPLGSLSPSTVRERSDGSPRAASPDHDSRHSKSSENVGNIIENSINFAKVKNLRIKISEELENIVVSLETRDVMNIDPAELVKMCRRSAEFSARFNRMHVYQLKRQINDLQRNNKQSLPFAKHTQFQAQMVRIASLHQNMLQAFQVRAREQGTVRIFHKSIEQTACVRESIDTLRGLVTICRLGAEASQRHLAAAGNGNLNADKVIPSCDGLDEAINEYAAKLSSYMESSENTHTSHSRKKSKGKKKSSFVTWTNKSMGSETRLSMYSLDTLRINLKGSKASKGSKDRSSGGTSKLRPRAAPLAPSPAPSAPRSPPARKGRKRSPRFRRPLMRDPNPGRTRLRRHISRDTEIRTMVETVDTITCTSSRVSCELPALKSPKRPPRAAESPLTPHKSPPRAPAPAPAAALPRSPNPAKFKRRMPLSAKDVKAMLNSGRNEQEVICLSARSTLGKTDKKLGNETQKKVVPELREAEVETPRPAAVSPRAAPSPRDGGDGARRGELLTSEKRCEIAARERTETSTSSARCEVTRIVRQLCGGDSAGLSPRSRNVRVSGAKNAQLLCVSGSSPRQPSTPQLLRILEETIQKKVPKQLLNQMTQKDRERFRMTFNLPEATTDRMFQYRTKFVQHMLTSPMYANSLVGKPWEVISRISDQIIDDLLTTCAKEIQLEDTLQKLYDLETR